MLGAHVSGLGRGASDAGFRVWGCGIEPPHRPDIGYSQGGDRF